jgi:thioredoxin-like negative regulator of GroEL
MTGKTRKQQLEEMLAEDPGDPFLRYGLAMEHVSAGDLEAAVRCFRELVAASPAYVPAYLQAGQVLTRLGRVEEAKEVFRQGIAAAARQGDQHAQGEMEGMLDGLE